jgi:hypothetical protein
MTSWRRSRTRWDRGGRRTATSRRPRDQSFARSNGVYTSPRSWVPKRSEPLLAHNPLRHTSCVATLSPPQRSHCRNPVAATQVRRHHNTVQEPPLRRPCGSRVAIVALDEYDVRPRLHEKGATLASLGGRGGAARRSTKA